MKVGLNLFSVRNLIGTEEEYEKTTMKLKQMGYSYVQYSGGAFDAERIRRVSEKTGIPQQHRMQKRNLQCGMHVLEL